MATSDFPSDGRIAINHYSGERVRAGLQDFLMGRGFGFVMGFATAILLVRAMPVAEYAVYVTLIGMQMILLTLASLGINRVITRFIPEAKQANATRALVWLVNWLFRWRLMTLAVVALCASIFTQWFAKTLNVEGHIVGFYLMWLFTILFGLGRFSICILQALMLQRVVKWATFTESSIRLFLLFVWLIYAGGTLSLEEALVVMCLAAFTNVMVLEISLWREVRAIKHSLSSIDFNFSTAEIFRFSINNYFQELLLLPSESSSMRLLGAYFLNPTAMAAFGFFQTVTGTFKRNLPAQMLLDFIEPVMTAAYLKERNFKLLNRMTGSVFKINLLLLAPLLAWITFESQSVTAILTGGKYVEHAWMLPIMVIGLVYESHWIVLRTIVNAVDKSAMLVRVGASSALCFAFIFVIMLSVKETHTAVLVFGAVLILTWQNVYAVLMLRRLGFFYTLDWVGFWKLLMVAALATIIAVCVTTLIDINAVSWLLTGIITLPIYLFFVRSVKPFGMDEQILLLRINRHFRYLF